MIFKPLETKINLNYIYRFSPYRAVNTLHLSYTNQAVNVVQWNNRCLFWESHKTHKYSPYRAVNTLRLSYKNQSVKNHIKDMNTLFGKNAEFFTVKPDVHKATNGL
jgi:hypothetical protein